MKTEGVVKVRNIFQGILLIEASLKYTAIESVNVCWL